MKRPTQADVAREAGVSRATVSYVLNQQDGQKIAISPDTRQHVLDVIAKLGYEPDANAQALRSGDTNTIGVLIPDIQNPFYLQSLYGITMEAEAAGYDIHISHSSLNPKQELLTLKKLLQRRVDGLILMISYKELTSSVLNQVNKTGRAVVEMGPGDSPLDAIYHHYAQGTRELMAHLLELGHRRIGFVYGVADYSLGLDRLVPYQEALRSDGLPADDSLIIHCGITVQDGYEAAMTLLSHPIRPTALVVINDLLAIGVLRAAADLGLNVPGDVSVASFDDIPNANYTIPRLTTVSGSTEEHGRSAVRLLLSRLSNPGAARQVIEFSSRLIVRESTGPCRTRNE